MVNFSRTPGAKPRFSWSTRSCKASERSKLALPTSKCSVIPRGSPHPASRASMARSIAPDAASSNSVCLRSRGILQAASTSRRRETRQPSIPGKVQHKRGTSAGVIFSSVWKISCKTLSERKPTVLHAVSARSMRGNPASTFSRRPAAGLVSSSTPGQTSCSHSTCSGCLPLGRRASAFVMPAAKPLRFPFAIRRCSLN